MQAKKIFKQRREKNQKFASFFFSSTFRWLAQTLQHIFRIPSVCLFLCLGQDERKRTNNTDIRPFCRLNYVRNESYFFFFVLWVARQTVIDRSSQINARILDFLFQRTSERIDSMNGNHHHHHNNNPMCNSNQISKNLPLKKRRTYMIDPSTQNENQDENFLQTTSRWVMLIAKVHPLLVRNSNRKPWSS